MILDASTEYMYLGEYLTYDSSRSSTVIDEIIKWGDRSIMLDFRRAFLGGTTEYARVSELVKGVITKDLLAFRMD
jgi:hypothetical protein